MSELDLVSEFGIYVPETAKNGEIRSGLSGGGGRANLGPPLFNVGKEGHSPLPVRRRALRGGVSKMHPFLTQLKLFCLTPSQRANLKVAAQHPSCSLSIKKGTVNNLSDSH